MALKHDELLAKIMRTEFYKEKQPNNVSILVGAYNNENANAKALRAVVELHKPKGNFADTYVNGEPNSPYCPECIDPDVYPCPTIQAIQEQLK